MWIKESGRCLAVERGPATGRSAAAAMMVGSEVSSCLDSIWWQWNRGWERDYPKLSSLAVRGISPHSSCGCDAESATSRMKTLVAYAEPANSISYLLFHRHQQKFWSGTKIVLTSNWRRSRYLRRHSSGWPCDTCCHVRFDFRNRKGPTYHRAGRYSISPGSKSTRMGLLRYENGVPFSPALSGSQVANGTGSASSSGFIVNVLPSEWGPVSSWRCFEKDVSAESPKHTGPRCKTHHISRRG